MAVDNKGLPYNSSGYGENGVDIAAPGVNVKTTLPDERGNIDKWHISCKCVCIRNCCTTFF